MAVQPHTTTELSTRDLSIIRLVSRFKQLTSFHINELLFATTTTRTPTDRALRRLVERGYLHRVERRLVGGSRGGSGQYVYGLGRKGFYMHFTGRFQPARAVQFHTLAITELYVSLRRLETAGLLSVAGLSTEPDCWAVIGRYELKPDLYVELERPSGERVKLWFEVDMGTEGQRQVRAKMDAVWRAYNEVEHAEWPVFPGTVWVAIDDEREKELRWIMEQLPEDARGLFRVCQLTSLPKVLGVSA
jgi:hypothetical protein